MKNKLGIPYNITSSLLILACIMILGDGCLSCPDYLDYCKHTSSCVYDIAEHVHYKLPIVYVLV